VPAVFASLMMGPLSGSYFKIVTANRLVGINVDVLGDYQKVSGSSQQRAPCCTFIGAVN
jgi:hypothetical protein